jgi:hypothetical protein
MNINEYTSKPTMFKDLKSSFVLCHESGEIIQMFTELRSAKYMLTEHNMGSKIFEIVEQKGKIISNLGEIYEPKL